MNMTPTVFAEKRGELIKILEAVCHMTQNSLCEFCKSLESSVFKLKRNCFEVALVSGPQMGHRTIINAICDGREILPQATGGNPIVAEIVSVCPIPAVESEQVELYWKSDDELLLQMMDLVKDNLEVGDRAYFSSGEDQSLGPPSLADKNTRDLVLKALSREWSTYANSPYSYDQEGAGRLKLLQTSLIVINSYEDQTLKDIRRRTHISVDELGKFVTVPSDWCARWATNGVETKWLPNEIAPLLLKRVNICIHSQTLDHIGISFTVCPNMFASPHEAKAAQDVLFNADVILYLISGESALTDACLRGIRNLKRLNLENKVLFAINAKQGFENTKKNLLPIDAVLIRQLGFEIRAEEDICIFNALLAFSSRYVSYDQKMWRKQTSSVVQCYMQLDMFDESCRESIDALLTDKKALYVKSGLESLLLKMETICVQKKFRIVLLDHGVKLAYDVLDLLRGDVSALGCSTDKKRMNPTTQVESIRRKLDRFMAGLAPYLC